MAGNSKGCMCGLFQKKAEADHGRVMVPSLNRMVSFRIVMPNASKDGKQESCGLGPCLLTSQATENDKKVHIKWNVDAAELQECSVQHNEALDSTVDEPNTPGVLSQRTRSLYNITSDFVHEAVYEDGQCVEYFSLTHQQWMRGTVDSEECTDNGQRAIFYNATLTHGHQLRPNVDLGLLRVPFESGELVELFSERKGGLRLPAVIAQEQSLAPSLLGYRVVVEENGQIFDQIPALRLKRRFLRNQHVEVYRGPDMGWQKATVHRTASANGCEEELLPVLAPPTLLKTDAFATMNAFANMNARRSMSPRVLTLEEARLKEGSVNQPLALSAFGLWTSVPVCTEGEHEDLSPEYVPSYLLRARSGLFFSI